jgi:diguanylate cyclase (GGDEF)-like protein
MRLRELTHQIGVRSDGWQEQQELLLSLFDLLLDNIGELLDDSSWLHGQVHAVRQLISGPLDRDSVDQARANLREVIYKQGLLKQGIVESKAAMKGLMGGFIERLDGMAVSTGEYHDRISSYALALKEARSIADLSQLLQGVLQDTGRVQEQALQARDHLGNARREVEQAEQRIAELEQELRDVSGLVRTDPLTGALNRRGFDELVERELARAGRHGHPLALALIDLDDFHQTNTAHGHAGGDAVLRQLVAVCQLHLRSTDAIARIGGDEFVLLLPETPAADSMSTLLRLQRSLAQRPLQLDDTRVPVHFSAGVAQWQAGEPVDALLRRADAALYAAKRVGKNRVQAADAPR